MAEEAKKVRKDIEYLTIVVTVIGHQGKVCPLPQPEPPEFPTVGYATHAVTLPAVAANGTLNLNNIAGALNIRAYNDAVAKGLVELEPLGVPLAPNE